MSLSCVIKSQAGQQRGCVNIYPLHDRRIEMTATSLGHECDCTRQERGIESNVPILVFPAHRLLEDVAEFGRAHTQYRQVSCTAVKMTLSR